VGSAASQAFIVCNIGRVLCSLPLGSVVETFRPLPVEPLAAAPAFVLGLSLVRGKPTPVVDLARLVSGVAGSPTRFVVMRTGDRTVVLAVDGVIGVRSVAADRIQALPPLLGDADADVVGAIGRLDAALFLVLQASRIMPHGFLDEVARRMAS
jgi:purine-binding chemotaxis protein CheW